MIGAGEDLVVLVDIGHGPGDVGWVTILENDARALHLVPLRAGGAALVTEDLLVISRRPGVTVILPIRDPVDRIYVPANSISGTRIDDVVDASAAPNVRILLISIIRVSYAGDRGPLRIDAVGTGLRIGARGLLLHVGTAQGVRDCDGPVALNDFEFAVVAREEADVGCTDLARGFASRPRTVERARLVDRQGNDLTDDDRVGAVR